MPLAIWPFGECECHTPDTDILKQKGNENLDLLNVYHIAATHCAKRICIYCLKIWYLWGTSNI